jgi:pyrroloquinoline quinone (PQQ) biosynthesis protein C
MQQIEPRNRRRTIELLLMHIRHTKEEQRKQRQRGSSQVQIDAFWLFLIQFQSVQTANHAKYAQERRDKSVICPPGIADT